MLLSCPGLKRPTLLPEMESMWYNISQAWAKCLVAAGTLQEAVASALFANVPMEQ